MLCMETPSTKFEAKEEDDDDDARRRRVVVALVVEEVGKALVRSQSNHNIGTIQRVVVIVVCRSFLWVLSLLKEGRESSVVVVVKVLNEDPSLF